MNTIDLGKAFRAPFQDKDWVTKTLLGFVWSLLVVTLPAVYGAQVEYISRVSHGDETLPEWSDFGTKWVRGLLVMIAGFIYFLPVAVISVIFFVPIMIASLGGSNAAASFAAGGTCLFMLIAIVYSIAVSVVFYAAVTNYAMSNDFGAFFQFSRIMARVRDGSGYFTAWLWALVAGVASSVVIGILSATGIGGILAPAVTYLLAMVIGHLFGQWAALSYGAPEVLSGSPSGYTPPTPIPPAPASVPPTSYPAAPPVQTPPPATEPTLRPTTPPPPEPNSGFTAPGSDTSPPPPPL